MLDSIFAGPRYMQDGRFPALLGRGVEIWTFFYVYFSCLLFKILFSPSFSLSYQRIVFHILTSSFYYIFLCFKAIFKPSFIESKTRVSEPIVRPSSGLEAESQLIRETLLYFC